MRTPLAALALLCSASAQPLPEGVTPEIQQAIQRGLSWLARAQNQDGSWRSAGNWGSTPCAMTASAGLAFLAAGSTPTRGPYAATVRRAAEYLTNQVHTSGLITVMNEEGRPMYGHGFATLFLAQVHGMEEDQARRIRIGRVLKGAVDLIAAAQSSYGGWNYHPEDRTDEGSVTVTQIQALRACRDAGITVPVETIDRAVSYIVRSANPDGGIRYTARGGGASRPPITAAAVATLYSAGKYEHPMAEKALAYARLHVSIQQPNTFYMYGHNYLAQALYQKGGEEWAAYYEAMAARLLARQGPNGAWSEDQTGPVYNTAVALVILQLPYGFVPAYQR